MDILERNEMFDQYYGPVDSPVKLAQRYMLFGRQTGKTTLMLESLPDGPCYIVCMSRDVGRDIIRKLMEMRPNLISSNYHVLVADNYEDLQNHCERQNLPVYVDNAVFDKIFEKMISDLYRNARH